jgi:ATP-dependent DNA helicase RecG
MKKKLDTPVQYIKGIGPKRAKILNKAGIKVIEDLLYYFPKRYEDRTKFLNISQLKVGEYQTIKAKVLAKGEKQSWRRRGFKILEVAVGDDTGKILCVWFNQPYLAEYFKVGTFLILYARIERYSGRLQMNSPEFEILTEGQDQALSIGRIVPIYSLPEGLTERNLRHLIKSILDEVLPQVDDILPYAIRSKNNLLNLPKSLLNIHFPENLQMQKEAFRRLCFEEFFIFQIPLALRKMKVKEKQGISHNIEGKLLNDFIAGLSFS